MKWPHFNEKKEKNWHFPTNCWDECGTLRKIVATGKKSNETDPHFFETFLISLHSAYGLFNVCACMCVNNGVVSLFILVLPIACTWEYRYTVFALIIFMISFHLCENLLSTAAVNNNNNKMIENEHRRMASQLVVHMNRNEKIKKKFCTELYVPRERAIIVLTMQMVRNEMARLFWPLRFQCPHFQNVIVNCQLMMRPNHNKKDALKQQQYSRDRN